MLSTLFREFAFGGYAGTILRSSYSVAQENNEYRIVSTESTKIQPKVMTYLILLFINIIMRIKRYSPIYSTADDAPG